MRNYSDEVEVRVSGPEESTVRGPEPTQFLWRGRLWKVRAVLARWVETPPWWNGVQSASAGLESAAPAAAGRIDELVADRECWRVEAGTPAGTGVFDLSLDHRDGHWELVGCAD